MKIALICIAKNENNYIQEWINYHLKLGFDDIYIYTNNWTYHNDQQIINIIPFNGIRKQCPAYNNFKEQYGTKYNWAAFIDVDEFIVLHQHNNIKSFLLDYSQYNAIGINWAIFGCNGHIIVENNDYGVLKRFTKRETENFEPNKHIKSIIQLPCNKFQDIHCVHGEWYNLNKEKRTGPYNIPVDYTIAQVNHYFTKSHQEFQEKCHRGRATTHRKKRFKNHWDYINANAVEDTKARDFLYV